jgi:hypothetical protein
MLAESFGWDGRKNIAPLVLAKVWAARQRRPALVEPAVLPAQKQTTGAWADFGLLIDCYGKINLRISGVGLRRNGSRGHPH